MTVHLTPEQEKEFQEISDECGLTVEELVHRSIDDFILFHPIHTKAIREALAEAERDGWIESEDLWDRVEIALKAKGSA